MSFTRLLLLSYIIISAGAVIAFKQKHKTVGIVLLLIIAISILILGYMWISSPM